MEQDPKHARQENALIFLAKYVERAADHVVNISEEIIYFVTGQKTDLDTK
jgi:phosphate transport system protein